LNSGQEAESALLTSQLKGVDGRLAGITEEAATNNAFAAGALVAVGE
jgi:hypothetical protein